MLCKECNEKIENFYFYELIEAGKVPYNPKNPFDQIAFSAKHILLHKLYVYINQKEPVKKPRITQCIPYI